MKKIKLCSLLIVACMFVMASCGPKSNQEEDSKEVAEDQNEAKFEDSKLEDDTEFAVAAADGGMYEVQAGQLALTKGSSAKVKEFAQKMVDDHGKGNEELKALAQQKNISIPAALSEKMQKKYDDLAAKSGADFDKAYCEAMVKDHKEDLDKFKKASEDAKDADVKTWASGKVPVLEHHLSMAEEMEKTVKQNQ
jgi:putative membrane protein